jgi:hypothetical protein
MPRLGFEPTILMFERSKIVRALDSKAIGTGMMMMMIIIIKYYYYYCEYIG